jgi:hypothetical protein
MRYISFRYAVNGPLEATGGINQSRGRIFSPITGLVILTIQNRRYRL